MRLSGIARWSVCFAVLGLGCGKEPTPTSPEQKVLSGVEEVPVQKPSPQAVALSQRPKRAVPNKPQKPGVAVPSTAIGTGQEQNVELAWWKMIRMPGNSYQGPLPVADKQLLSLTAELRRDVKHLAEEIGERNILRHPKELAQAADWIEAEWAKMGYEVKRQRYEVSGVTCCNLDAELLGTSLPEEIVVIGAHYDSVVGTPGANDNGSGVAAVLALARRFAPRKTDRTLRFVAFVNEEPPYFQTEQMGSWVYAKRCRQRNEKITAMLTPETIGYYSDSPGSQKYPPPLNLLYPSTGNFIGFVGNTARPTWCGRWWRPSGSTSNSPPKAVPRPKRSRRRLFRPLVVLAGGLSGPDGDRHGDVPLSALPRSRGYARQNRFRANGPSRPWPGEGGRWDGGRP